MHMASLQQPPPHLASDGRANYLALSRALLSKFWTNFANFGSGWVGGPARRWHVKTWLHKAVSAYSRAWPKKNIESEPHTFSTWIMVSYRKLKSKTRRNCVHFISPIFCLCCGTLCCVVLFPDELVLWWAIRCFNGLSDPKVVQIGEEEVGIQDRVIQTNFTHFFAKKNFLFWQREQENAMRINIWGGGVQSDFRAMGRVTIAMYI